MKKNQQYYVLKLNTSYLKKHKYNLDVSFNEALALNQVVAVGDSAVLREIRRLTKHDVDLKQIDEWFNLRKKIKSRSKSKENAKKIAELTQNINDALYIPEYVSVFVDNVSHYEYINQHSLVINGKEYVRSVGTFCKELTNCKTQGTIKADSNCAGICYKSTKMENCINYANITSVKGTTAGGISTRGSTFLNCKNHGDVSATQQVGGILAFETPLSLRIEGCDNYGDVKATQQYYAGGIIGLAYTQQSNLMIKNCNNYGDVYSEKGYVAGIIAFAEGYLDIVNCTNKGDVNWIDLHGELVGAFRAQYGNVKDSYLRIINSKVEKNVDYSSEDRFIGGFYNAKDSIKIEILNCSVRINVLGNKNYKFIVLYIPANIDLVSIKNLDIVLISENSTPKISILSNKPNIQTKYDFENINVYIKAPSDNAVQLFPAGEYGDNVNIDGVISTVVTPKKMYKTYYGNNFSGFYSNWKNSEIGLKAFSGKGFYQRNVTEEYLISKGYEKKVV